MVLHLDCVKAYYWSFSHNIAAGFLPQSTRQREIGENFSSPKTSQAEPPDRGTRGLHVDICDISIGILTITIKAFAWPVSPLNYTNYSLRFLIEEKRWKAIFWPLVVQSFCNRDIRNHGTSLDLFHGHCVAWQNPRNPHMRIGWFERALSLRNGSHLPTTQCACAEFEDFAKQRNGCSGREKDL
jgi:hypothetical protein